MPIYKSYSPNSSTCIKVWKISESFNELLSSIDISKNTIEKLDKVQSDARKCEILSVRHLLKEFGFSDNDLFYNENGKPMLSNKKYISISHSKLFSSIIISDFNISIDIDQITPLKLMPFSKPQLLAINKFNKKWYRSLFFTMK